MSYDDTYLRAGRLRYAELRSQQMQEVANLNAYKVAYEGSGGTDIEALRSMGTCEGNLGCIQNEMQNLERLGQQHIASLTPAPPPAPLTAEEKVAKPWDKCDWNDTAEWANKSRYGIDVGAFKAGMAEVMRRKARGE